jgi:hypothetical protein
VEDEVRLGGVTRAKGSVKVEGLLGDDVRTDERRVEAMDGLVEGRETGGEGDGKLVALRGAAGWEAEDGRADKEEERGG